MAKVVAMLLAGGQGSRLSLLSRRRAKPAVPFGGSYRIIDFTLSNVMHAGIPVVGILTQYKPHSLAEHVGTGESWGFTGRDRAARVLAPYQGNDDSDWYAGTADAIWQNRDFIDRHAPDVVVVLSGDHIYRMDYAAMIDHHLAHRADVTIAVQEVPWEDTSRFGLVKLDDDSRIVAFQEKPKFDPVSNLASLGIYAFDARKLMTRLAEDAADPTSEKDFGNNVLPAMLKQDVMTGWRFDGYWRDVGTLESFHQAHMEALDPAGSGLDLAAWGLRTNTYEAHMGNYHPARLGPEASVSGSLLARGCVVEGTVERSVLFPGVRVGRGARVVDSILMGNVTVGEGAVLDRVISDKDVTVGSGAVIGAGGDGTMKNVAKPHLLDAGITLLGERATLPDGARIGRNVMIHPGVETADFPHGGAVACGGTVERGTR